MKFSVAMVTYNSVTKIKESLDSVLTQTYQDLEIVVIDGGSTDGTLNIIKNNEDKIKWISESDKGIYDAMNKALHIASGDFIIFLGSDDHFISQDILNTIANNIKDLNSVYYGNVLRPLSLDIYCGKYNSFKLAVKNICHQAIFYPKIVYKNYEYDISYKLNADYAYNLKLWNKYKYVYIPIVVSYYNQFGVSSGSIDKKFENDRYLLTIRSLGFVQYLFSVIYHFLRNLIK